MIHLPVHVRDTDGRVAIIDSLGNVVTEVLPSFRDMRWSQPAVLRREIAERIALALNGGERALETADGE